MSLLMSEKKNTMMFTKFLAPFFRGFTETPEESFSKALNKANTSFYLGKDKEIGANLASLLEHSYSSNDISFIADCLPPLLSSQDISTRIIAFRAISLLLTPSSPSIQMLPASMRRSFQYHILLIPALNALTYIMTPFVFHCLKKDLLEIAKSSDDLPRILAMNCIFKIYKQSPKKIKYLMY